MPDIICDGSWGKFTADIRGNPPRRTTALRTAFYWLAIIALAVACVK